MFVYCCVGVLSCWYIVVLLYCHVGVLLCWCSVVFGVLLCWCVVLLVYCCVAYCRYIMNCECLPYLELRDALRSA